MKTHDKLNRPLKDRVAYYKKRHDPNSCIGDWREMRKVIGGYINPEANRRTDKGRLWIEDTNHLREVGPAHKIIRLRHTGWYVHDDDYGDTTHGVVYRLTHGRFLAGFVDPWNDGPVCVDLSVYDTERDAAIVADRMAELWAEDCRESDRRHQIEYDIEEKLTEISSLRESVVELVRGIRKSVLDATVCERLRQDVRDMLAEKTRLFREIEELEASK